MSYPLCASISPFVCKCMCTLAKYQPVAFSSVSKLPGALVAQYVKHWPTDLAVPGLSPA